MQVEMEFDVIMKSYKKAEIKTNDDSISNGNGGKLDVTKVTSEGLSNDVHGEGSDAAENRGTHNKP